MIRVRGARIGLAGLTTLTLAGCGTTGTLPLAPPCFSGRYPPYETCKETSDGYYVPPSYYATLQREEHTQGVPHLAGTIPTNPEYRQPATPAQPQFHADPEGNPTERPE